MAFFAGFDFDTVTHADIVQLFMESNRLGFCACTA